MTDREPIPTFKDKWDRITFLLHSYRLWIGLFTTAGLVALIYIQPTIPVPPEVIAAIGGFALIGVGALPVGFKIGRWLRGFRAVEVYHFNAPQGEIEKYYVPPAVWENKTVKNAEPWPVNDGTAWAVREYEWVEATETLVVDGCWLADAADPALAYKKTHMEEMHTFLLDTYQIISQLRGRFSRMAMDVERQTVNAVHEAQEKGTTLNRTAIKEIWNDAAEELRDVIPDDHPELDEIEEINEERSPEPDATKEVPRDQMTPKANGGPRDE